MIESFKYLDDASIQKTQQQPTQQALFPEAEAEIVAENEKPMQEAGENQPLEHNTGHESDGITVPDLIPKRNLHSSVLNATNRLHCDVCPYRTNKSGLLKIHKTYHQIQPNNKFKCKYCPYYVSAPRLLHQHVRLHLHEEHTQQQGEGMRRVSLGSDITGKRTNRIRKY